MTSPILDLGDASSWVQVYDTTLFANPVFGREGKYYPIPSHSIPAIFEGHTLAIGSSSTKAKPTWNLGFYLAQIVSVPGVGSAEARSIPIRLGLNLVRFPPLSVQFRLKARIPKWHEEMSVTIWKYVGVESDVLDKLADLEPIVTRIESKVDEINSWGNA